jgi:hypothetical protein
MGEYCNGHAGGVDKGSGERRTGACRKRIYTVDKSMLAFQNGPMFANRKRRLAMESKASAVHDQRCGRLRLLRKHVDYYGKRQAMGCCRAVTV